VKKVTQYPAIQAALADVEEQLQFGSTTISDKTRSLIDQAGFEVATVALKEPGKYLGTLSTLRKLSNGTVEPGNLQAAFKKVRADFWAILPEETWSPTRGRRTLHPLDRAVIEQLTKHE
jgi:hypothetical protein